MIAPVLRIWSTLPGAAALRRPIKMPQLRSALRRWHSFLLNVHNHCRCYSTISDALGRAGSNKQLVKKTVDKHGRVRVATGLIV